jgi:xanthosine utilization system XapX-like protein
MNELLSRKFIFAIIALIMGFVLVLMKLLPAEGFIAFVGIVGSTYVIGNVASKYANTKE